VPAGAGRAYRLQVRPRKLGQRQAYVSERWSGWMAPPVHSKWASKHARRGARPRPARRRGLSLFLDDSTGIPGTSYQKHTLLTLQSYGVMSASGCRTWWSPRMSVRQCLCRADNRPDSLSLQQAEGTVEERVHLRSRRALKRCLRCSRWPTGRASYYESSRQKVCILRLFLAELRDQ
jgi:hypothetical protein